MVPFQLLFHSEVKEESVESPLFACTEFTQCLLLACHAHKMCIWSCKVVCTLLNEIPSICMSCRVMKHGSMATNTPAVLNVSLLSAVTGMPGLPSNSQFSQPFWNLECHPKQVDFFIQASPYRLFNSWYDSSCFLFACKEFEGLPLFTLFMSIFRGKVHYGLLRSNVEYEPQNHSVQNSDCKYFHMIPKRVRHVLSVTDRGVSLSLYWTALMICRCLAGRMAMHAWQIGPTDTAPRCPGSPLWACVGTSPHDMW